MQLNIKGMTREEILQALLEGLEWKLMGLANKREQIRQHIEGSYMIPGFEPSSAMVQRGRPKGSKNKPKRTMSAAGRAAVKAAQKKRWAAFHKARRKAGK
jgi:hypothetical protein